MKLVKNAHRAYRWFSMQALLLAGGIQMTWMNLPPEMQASIPPGWVTKATLAVLVFGAIGRLVQQDDET